jgi:hypothetical protein
LRPDEANADLVLQIEKLALENPPVGEQKPLAIARFALDVDIAIPARTDELRYAKATIGALMGHSRGTVTGRYIHTVDSLLVMAADTVAGHIQGVT